MPVRSDAVRWHVATRVVFRVAAIYVFLQSLNAASGTGPLPGWLAPLGWFDPAIPWIGQHLLRLQTPLDGSVGVLISHLLMVVVSLAGGGVWSVLDGRRPNYRVLDQWLRVWVRFALACVLFGYGWAKVYPMQFHNITRADLVRPLGNLTHVKLMWRFMAASKPYTSFAGWMEVTAGILLLVPGLTELGALLCLVVMSNVAVMDWSYNVIVKVLPVNLALMALYLCAPQLLRMADLLVRNRPVVPWAPARLSGSRWVGLGARVALGVLGGVFCVRSLLQARQTWAERQSEAQARVPMQGIWQVEAFSATGGAVFTPEQAGELHLAPGEERWLRVIFDEPDTLTVQTMNGAMADFDLKFDAGKAEIADGEDKGWKGELKFAPSGADQLGVQGEVNGAAVTATLRRVDEGEFPLTDEGLHWVHWDVRNSSPYGR